MTASVSQGKKRVLLVDDHPLLRRGIAQLINQQPDLMVCGEAGDRSGALAVAAQTQPDVAVIDLSLKEERGLDLLKDFKARSPQLFLLVLSMHEETFYAERALRAGARGYVMKGEASEKVIEAIRHVLVGGIFLSEPIASEILAKVSSRPSDPSRSLVAALSDRELEVLILIGKGYGAQQLARRLKLSVKTIEAHRAHIKAKLALSTSGDLLQFAIQWAHQIGEV